MKRKIFIFGGQGFIGTNLAIFFSRSNDVYVIGNKSRLKKNPLKSNKKIKKISIDIFNIKKLKKNRFKDSIIIVPIPFKHKVIKEKYKILIKYLFEQKPYKIILLSSVAIYGNSKKKVNENSKIQITSKYSKYCKEIENICINNYKKNCYLNILRIGNVFGSYRNSPSFIEKLLLNFKYNKKFKFYNQKLVRSYLSINNLIQIINKLKIKKTRYIIYNVSNPNFIFSQNEIINNFKNENLLKNYITIKPKKSKIKIKTSIIDSSRIVSEFKISYKKNFIQEVKTVLNNL